MAAPGEFFFGTLYEVGLRMRKHGFGSGHRGVATADYDLNFDPEVC